jgi:uncharacterized membrane protein YuzA (DUF378 family)
MKAVALLVLVVALHVTLLIGAYSTGFFGLARSLPYTVVVAIWLGFFSAAAGVAYYMIGKRAAWPSSPWRFLPFAVAAVAVSLYVGVFLSFNTFGT